MSYIPPVSFRTSSFERLFISEIKSNISKITKVVLGVFIGLAAIAYISSYFRAKTTGKSESKIPSHLNPGKPSNLTGGKEIDPNKSDTVKPSNSKPDAPKLADNKPNGVKPIANKLEHLLHPANNKPNPFPSSNKKKTEIDQPLPSNNTSEKEKPLPPPLKKTPTLRKKNKAKGTLPRFDGVTYKTNQFASSNLKPVDQDSVPVPSSLASHSVEHLPSVPVTPAPAAPEPISAPSAKPAPAAKPAAFPEPVYEMEKSQFQIAKEKLLTMKELSSDFFSTFDLFCGELFQQSLTSKSSTLFYDEITSVLGAFTKKKGGKYQPSLADQVEELLTEIIEKYEKDNKIKQDKFKKFGENLPPFFANVAKKSVYQTYLDLLGIRNLLAYGPSSLDEIRAKQYIITWEKYAADTGVQKIKTYTGTTIDLETEFDAKDDNEAILFAQDKIIEFAMQLAPKETQAIIDKNPINPGLLTTQDLTAWGLKSKLVKPFAGEPPEVTLQYLILEFSKREGLNKPKDSSEGEVILEMIKKRIVDDNKSILLNAIDTRLFPGRNLHLPKLGHTVHTAYGNADRGNHGVWKRQKPGHSKIEYYVNVPHFMNIFKATVRMPFMLAEILFLAKESAEVKDDPKILENFYTDLYKDEEIGIITGCVNAKAQALDLFCACWKSNDKKTREEIIRDNLLNGLCKATGRNILSRNREVIDALIQSHFTRSTLVDFIRELYQKGIVRGILSNEGIEDVPKVDLALTDKEWVAKHIADYRKILSNPHVFNHWLEQNRDHLAKTLKDPNILKDLRINKEMVQEDSSTLWENCLYITDLDDENLVYGVFNQQSLEEVLTRLYDLVKYKSMDLDYNLIDVED